MAKTSKKKKPRGADQSSLNLRDRLSQEMGLGGVGRGKKSKKKKSKRPPGAKVLAPINPRLKGKKKAKKKVTKRPR